MHHLVIFQLTSTSKLSLRVNLVPYQKSLDTEPINCVGVQTFEHSELKFTNVRMLKFHIRLCSSCQTPLRGYKWLVCKTIHTR